MTIKSFHLTSFKSESSRDSNSQLTHFEYADGVLSTCEEWRGEHPRGGAGRMPALRSRLNAEQLKELESAFRERDLLRSRSEISTTGPIAAPPPPSGPSASEGASPPAPAGPGSSEGAPRPSSAPGAMAAPGFGGDSHTYGITLEVTTDSGVATLESSYSSPGPRVTAEEQRPLFVQLKALQELLRDLSFRAEAIK